MGSESEIKERKRTAVAICPAAGHGLKSTKSPTARIFPLKGSFKLLESIRYLFRNIKRFPGKILISCCGNFLSRIFGGITGNSKSAILFLLKNFDRLFTPISELIHLARCVKFNPYFYFPLDSTNRAFRNRN